MAKQNDYSAKQYALSQAIEVLKEGGSPFPYSYLSGAMSVYLTQEEAEQILAQVKKFYGDKNEETTNA